MEELGTVSQGTGKEAEDRILEHWEQTSKAEKPHPWKSISPPPSTLHFSGNEYTWWGPGSNNHLLNSRSDYCVDLWARQAIWLSCRLSLIFCKLTDEVFGLGFPLKRPRCELLDSRKSYTWNINAWLWSHLIKNKRRGIINTTPVISMLVASKGLRSFVDSAVIIEGIVCKPAKLLNLDFSY